MSMERKQQLKDGTEYDWLYAKRWYCYLQNMKSRARRSIKRGMNKRMRQEGRDAAYEGLSATENDTS